MTESVKESEDEEESTVVQLIFQKERTEAVDFEVAFTALLATGVFTTLRPESSHRLLLQSIASLLLVMTVLRRMAIVGRFAREKRIMQSTQQPVEFLALICVFQILQSVSTHLCLRLGCPLSSDFITLSLALVFVTTMIIVQQLLYRDYFVFWGATFYVYGWGFKSEAEDGSYLRGVVFQAIHEIALQLAYLTLKDNIPPHDDQSLEALREFVGEAKEQIEQGETEKPRPSVFMLISGIPLILMYLIPILLLSWFLGDTLLLVFLAFAAVPAVGHIIKFLYLGYGSPSENKTYSVKRQFLGIIVYIATVLFLFL
jgi:hypothetical protein